MFKKTNTLIRKFYYLLISLSTQCYCYRVWADLPPAPDNSDISKGDYLAGAWDFISEAIKYAALGLAAVAIIGYGYALVANFLEARKQREWGHFGMVAVIGAFVVVIAIVLATVANTHFVNSN